MTVNDQLTEAVEIYYSDKVQCDVMRCSCMVESFRLPTHK